MRKDDGLKRGKWSEDELQFLRDNAAIKKGKWCAEQLGRPFHATHKMIKKLDIKSEWVYLSVDKQGYAVDISDRSNKIYQHRKVMEQYLGRKLLSEEIVHHIDGNKLNNDISNLELTNRSKHIDMHREELHAARGIASKT